MATAKHISETEFKGKWGLGQKILFRYFFVLLLLHTWFGYNILNEVAYPRYERWQACTDVLGSVLYWLDKHYYHLGTVSQAFARVAISDKATGWVLCLTLFWVSGIICLVWSIWDRKRKNYDRLNFWFKNYLAYYLFLSMAFYAVYKIAAVQMPVPNGAALLKRVGDQTKIEALFNFMGISPGYSFFTGLCELAGAILVLVRRTRALGTMIMCGILMNVVSLNIFYNVAVKLLSLQLLVVDFYLLIPYLSKLIRFFCGQELVSLAEKQYKFATPWKNHAITALLIIPVWVTGYLFFRAARIQNADLARREQKLYNVVSFSENNTVHPALLDDTFRIRRILFTAYYGRKYALVYHMDDRGERYSYTKDSIRRLIRFGNNGNNVSNGEFRYYEFPGKKLKLSGQWHARTVDIILQEGSIDTFPLVSGHTNWIELR